MNNEAVDIEGIQEAIREGRWHVTLHARQRAGGLRLFDEDVASALLGGEILEDYPEDPRGHSCLALGRLADGRPLHLVCALDPMGDLAIITVYLPEPPRWVDERTRRPRLEGENE